MSETPLWRRYLRFLGPDVRADVQDELRYHLEMRTQELIDGGFTPAEARAEALRHFGDVAAVERDLVARGKSRARVARWTDHLRGTWLDFKIGLRMLAKHPGLTLVSVLTMTTAVGVAALLFAVLRNVESPAIPLDEGDRLVNLQRWSPVWNMASPAYLHDFAHWRGQLASVEELGAYRVVHRNLITDDGISEPVQGAEMSASGFRAARVAPVMGRPLLETDELPGAPDVAVIGYGVWQGRFGSDPGVVGRTMRIDGEPHTVVGVMPEGFRFPFNERLWIPLRDEPLEWARMEGPRTFAFGVFGRLADGVSLEQAQAELTAIGLQSARERPDTLSDPRTQVVRFGDTWAGSRLPFRLARWLSLALLVVVCTNVGALIYARNATRERELTVRVALGASRRRIVLQLFLETLALVAAASLLGLLLASRALGMVTDVAATQTRWEYGVPFWWSRELAPGTVAYVAALSVVAASVSGLLPAVKLTRVQLHARLQRLSAWGATLRFSRAARVAMVVQVAVSVGLLTLAIGRRSGIAEPEPALAGLAAERYLTARIALDQVAPPGTDAAAFQERFRHNRSELSRRLMAHPDVRGVAYATALPGTEHPLRRVEVANGEGDPAGATVRVAEVDGDYFDEMETPLVAGRAFGAGDVAPGGDARPVVIVNESLAERFLGGRAGIGGQVRFLGPDGRPGPWLEVVGIVPDLGTNPGGPADPSGAYLPLTSTSSPVRVVVRSAGDLASLPTRLRTVAAAVDPAMRVMDVSTLAGAMDAARAAQRAVDLAIVLGTVAALILSLTTLYAVMSLLVTQRTREIGIRVALGARPARVVAQVVARTFLQLGTGAVVGIVLIVMLPVALGAGSVGVAVKVAALLLGAGALSCAAPIRNALRIQPTEAMRADV